MSAQQSRVVLLFGGFWQEREISMASAQRVAVALRGAGLLVTPVRWDADGWVVLPDPEENLAVPGLGRSPLEVLGDLCEDGLGVVFNALHGGPGEDGSVQGLLTSAGVPFTGAGVGGSAVTYDKAVFRFAAQALGCEVAPGAIVHREQYESHGQQIIAKIAMDVGIPSIVKPVGAGSSYDVTKVNDADELVDAMEALLTRERRILVERFVPGRELSISVLGTRVGGPPQVLPPIEIEPLTESGIFDYEAKYSPGKCRETVPAPLEPGVARALSEQVTLLHRELDLGAASRTDIILGPDGPVFLECNTVPGLTEGSLLPQCAEATGIDFTALCRRFIDYALSVYLSRGAETPLDPS